jgi:GDP-L-fucose synthase
VWIAGHTGLVGSALVRRLKAESVEILTATSAQADLRRQTDAEAAVERLRPDVIFLAAAKVGGIEANRSAQGQFLYDNLMIGANVLEAARRAGVAKTIVLGSSCIYPRAAPQPISEDALLSGALEPTNEGYAIAKIATLELGKFYRQQYDMDVISLMPTNLYGPGDNFDPLHSHVLAALIAKFHAAATAGADTVEIWGTGTPRREFLHADDLADAAIFAACNYSDELHLNVGAGKDLTIAELAGQIAEIAGWQGELVYRSDMPDGMPRKLLDVSRLSALGWTARIELREGIRATYDWYADHVR